MEPKGSNINDFLPSLSSGVPIFLSQTSLSIMQENLANIWHQNAWTKIGEDPGPGSSCSGGT